MQKILHDDFYILKHFQLKKIIHIRDCFMNSRIRILFSTWQRIRMRIQKVPFNVMRTRIIPMCAAEAIFDCPTENSHRLKS